MAVIFSGITCPLCNQVISDEGSESVDLFATSHFLDDPQNPLSQYSDTAMHNACFMAWEHRLEFVRLYNENAIAIDSRWDGHREQMQEDGEIIYTSDSGEIIIRDEAAVQAFIARLIAEWEAKKVTNQSLSPY